MPQTLTRTGGSPRVHPFSRMHHQSPHRDVEDRNLRKRIAVACSRCRKRKIKCSGDQGTGSCGNCKNAGFGSQCQFLRVNSDNLSFGNPQLDWPYLVGGLTSAPVMMHQGAVNPYPVHGQPATLGSSYPGANRSSRSLPSPYSFPSSSGQEYYGYAAANENLDPFAYHQASQPSFPPNGDGTTHPAMYSSHENMRQWPSGLPPTRCGSHGYDQDLGLSRYPPSTTNSYSSLHTGNGSSDSQSIFPGMSTITSSLPSSAAMGDRLLPDPRANPVLPSASDAMHPAPMIGSADTKLPVSMSSSERGSISSSTGMPSSVKSASPSEATSSDAPSLSFSTRSSVSSTHPGISASAFEADSSSLGTPPASYHGLSLAPPQSLPRAPTSIAGSASTAYAYGLDRKRGSQSSADGSPTEGTLMSGRQYTHLVPRPQQPLSTTGTKVMEEISNPLRSAPVSREPTAMR